MPAPTPIPPALMRGPFTFGEAIAAGLSEKVLRGKRFRRLFPRVWVWAAHEMSDRDWIYAAELALPSHARASHLTRLRKLGLDLGPLFPLQFTVQGELHLDLEGIDLHRTKVMPPTDDHGVTPASAFVQVASEGRLIDLIKIGDWLLHREHMSIGDLLATGRRDHWRPGAASAISLARRLDGRSRSLKESETRALIEFAGLPVPEPNVDVLVDGRFIACVDLLLRAWLLVIEYEGRQHAEDPIQFNRDIGRYADLRDGRLEYVQVTQEGLRNPRQLMLRIHTKLVERGYDGPAPVFGPLWRSLFARWSPQTPNGGDLASKIHTNVDAKPPPLEIGGR